LPVRQHSTYSFYIRANGALTLYHEIAQIRKDRQDTSKRIEYSLFFVSQRTMLCERVLEEEGVLGDITLGEFAMEWIPFEDDLLSMELDNNTWKELNLVCENERRLMATNVGDVY
jgi:hypothetical protein